jgi:hypothetical protein
MDISPRRPGTFAPPPRLSIRVREMIDRDGAPAVAERLHVGRGTAERLAGRLPVRRATVIAVARELGMELEREEVDHG